MMWGTRSLAIFVACTAALALSACSGDDASSTQPDEASSSVPPVGDDWDLDQAGIMRLYESQIDDYAEQYQITDPPDVELIRFVTADEWPTAQVECLEAAGVGASVGPQDGVYFDDVPAEQGPAVNLAAYICAVSYPMDPRTQGQLPRVRAEMQYHYLVDTVAPCVEELGYDVSQPPSLETWLERYYSDQTYWDPYADLADQIAAGSTALDDAYEYCPHDAPDLYPSVAN